MVERRYKEPQLETPFPLSVLFRGEKGIDISLYKDNLLFFIQDLFPHQTSEHLQGLLEDCAALEWEAVVLAFDKEKLIGFGSMTTLLGGNMELDLGYIDPEYRRKGIHTQILEKQMEIAREKGALRVTISPMPTNMAKESYVARHGFVSTPSPSGVGGHLFIKHLN